MYKVEITNVHGGSFGQKFETEELANEWIADEIAKNSWGYPERWIHEDNMTELLHGRVIEQRTIEDSPEHQRPIFQTDENGNIVYVDEEQEIEGETVIVQVPVETGEYETVPAVTHIEYKVPDDYEITTEDITAEHEKQIDIQKHNKKIGFGLEIIAYIGHMNTQRGLETSQISSLSQDYASILNNIITGALGTAITNIQALTPTPPIDEAYKTEVVNKIQEYIDKV